jgi:REP element-mobilizing transposase RayT
MIKGLNMNKYNPNIHHRRSIRLKGFDYSQTGLYFITLCVQDRICLFGKIADDEILLNDFGIIVWENWEKLPERFPNVKLDVFQIMPNHIHGIIHVGATLAVAQNARNDAVAHNDAIGAGAIRAGASPAPTRTGSKTVGDIVGAYKSLVANDCLKIFKQKNVDERMGKLWQRNYYEHIIGDEQSYQRISEYIINNPKNWKEDQLYNQI